MAEIRPFGALRFTEKAGDLASCLCPPYDIIPESERVALAEQNPNNVIRLELPRGENPYEQAAATLKDWMERGILAEDAEEGLYVYEEEFEVKGEIKKIRGLVCTVRLEEFSKGVVLPHEETLSKAKQDRFNLMCACGCNFSQIYSMYLDPEKVVRRELDKIASTTPENDLVTSDGITQRLWVCRDRETIAKIADAFSEKQLYIADGHHRYETAINYRNHLHEQGVATDPDDKANFVMMYLIDIDDEGLVIFPTHRVLFDLEAFDLDAVLAKVSEYFTVEHREGTEGIEDELAKYADTPSFALYVGGDSWKLLRLKDASVLDRLITDRSAAYRALDVTALHSLILEVCFGIDRENMANQKNLIYTRDEKEALDLVREGRANCSFILNPTKIHQIRDVAAASDKMPQKSTYFYPKLITGLTMNKLL